MSWGVAEVERRLANMIRIGVISEVDHGAKKIRVSHGGLKTAWLPWPVEVGRNFKRWRPLREGQQVVLASPSGDLTQAAIIGMLYTEALDAPNDNPDIDQTLFDDGTSVQYDSASHVLTVDVPDGAGQVVVNCAGSVTVNSPKIDLGEPDDLEPSVLGNKLAAWIESELKPWLDSHVHIGNLGVPTGPAQAAPTGPFLPGTGAEGGEVYSEKNRNQ